MKRCTKCGEEKPLEDFYVDRRAPSGRTSACKICVRAAQQTYNVDLERRRTRERGYWKDPEYRAKAQARTRNWQERNRDRFLATKKAYREANKERVAAAWKNYYEANREELNAKGRAWAAANPDKKRAARDPEKSRDYAHRRRAKLKLVESDDHTHKEIFERDGGICQHCWVELDYDDSTSWEIDHIVPIDLFGPDIRANVQLLCRGCNRRKHARLEGQTYFAA